MWEKAILGVCQAEALWIAKSEVGGVFILMKMGVAEVDIEKEF